MVAGSHYHCHVTIGRFINFWWQQRRCTIYLFTLLNEVAKKT